MISHTHKFIFVWNRRTAGTSMTTALYPFGLQRYGTPRDRPKGFTSIRHLPARRMVTHRDFGPWWMDYFKFGFVRNPWDRTVSIYLFWKERFKRQGMQTFETFVKALMILPGMEGSIGGDHRYPSQYDMLYSVYGKLIVDFVGRFENLNADFAEVCRRIGVCAKLSHVNSTKGSTNYRTYYDDVTAELVGNFFKSDVDCFGYKF